MKEDTKKGRVTIPTDLDIVEETRRVQQLWGADALRDADGTEFPKGLQDTGAKIYATYYTTRKDNEWAKRHPEEIQQCYIMTGFHTAEDEPLHIPIMQGISPELMQPNTRDDISRWWEVVNRSTGQPLDPQHWMYDKKSSEVVIPCPQPWNEYTVSFLAYLIWDPVHMYNAVVNDWQDVEHQMTFDVRQLETKAWSLKRLERFIEEHPYVDVIRFTTFFHQFTLVFDELRRERYVDWYGYSASVSPFILEQFECEVGYPFRPEYIIDEGYYNNQYRAPSREYLDFMAFQRREVAKLARDLVDICHRHGKEAMMFLGDHWIGMEPYMEEFASVGLDAVVGSVGNGATLRLISDIPGVRYTEGRFLPYFFPDTFHEGGDPVAEARENWLCARRAMLRSPVDRIGYGGYLKLALDFPDFMDYIQRVCDEYRELMDNMGEGKPFSKAHVAVLNCWGKCRSWGSHMVHHGLYHPENLAYFGPFEALAGAPVDVSFLSFDEIVADGIPPAVDTLLICGGGDTAHTGGAAFENPALAEVIRCFVHRGGGLVGIGEPSGHQYGGHYLQLAGLLGVEKETGYTLGYAKYSTESVGHYILEELDGAPDFTGGARHIYALPGAQVLARDENGVQLAVNSYGTGRSVYISGLPYNAINARCLMRAILWSSGRERMQRRWEATNPYLEVNYYPDTGKCCVVNNSYRSQSACLHLAEGQAKAIKMLPGELRWYQLGNPAGRL